MMFNHAAKKFATMSVFAADSGDWLLKKVSAVIRPAAATRCTYSCASVAEDSIIGTSQRHSEVKVIWRCTQILRCVVFSGRGVVLGQCGLATLRNKLSEVSTSEDIHKVGDLAFQRNR